MAETITNETAYENNDNASTGTELNVSLDQLSYMCEYCGKVNALSDAKCVRCGKRRPRSEYNNAMDRIRSAGSVTDAYIMEEARRVSGGEGTDRQQLVRLVESRVSDATAHIKEQESVRFEQEADDIRRTTARDAVLRIIDAERVADQKVREAEARAEEAINGKNREIEERIATEREKVLYAAAKRVISERAGIENAAEERIAAEKKDAEMKAQETIEREVEEARRSEARKAVLKIVANEQAAEDRARLERDAISRAALERVMEEREIAEKMAYSKFMIEKEAIQRAVDERIRAERELLYGKRDAAPGYGGGAGTQGLAIVPYVNSQQPLYQYTNGKVVYKFVPDEEPMPAKKRTAVSAEAPALEPAPEVGGKKSKKKH